MFECAREILDRQVAQGICHGYALAVGQKERMLSTAVGGSVGGPGTAAVSLQTRYDVASLTGIMVTMPLMMVALEQGRLSLRDRLSMYFPVPADKKSLTLFHLLTHTSGMENDFLLEQTAANAQNVMDSILARPLASPVGKHARYSAIAIIALGKVLEQVFGMSLDRAARQFVFTPLGMKHTGYLPTGEHIAYTAANADTGEPRIGTSNDANTLFLRGISGNGGLFSNVEDCARFLKMLVCGGLSENGAFLSCEVLRQATTLQTSGAEKGFGFCMQMADSKEDPFLGDLWPASGCGLVSYLGCSLALDVHSGLYVAVLMNRMGSTRESDGMLRMRRLTHNSICAELLRSLAMQEGQH